MGWLTPKYPTSDTPGATAVTLKPSRRERREAAHAEHQQQQRTSELRMTALAVANGGDTDLNAFRKVAKRMTPDATDAELRQAHAWVRSRK